eukprot:TRINITY_DN2819_c0_g1_i1.p1 TRINITY_DN2819_c0_g1~~TRINITY_DN2819_c0_g1_i1.p1  ORF type:complete len:368 (-),score=88.61 TRINITY_DN2819_c0_g1_i1:54-1157(-)
MKLVQTVAIGFVAIVAILVAISYQPIAVPNKVMKAIMTTQQGVIEYVEIPVPVPEYGQVLVKVNYAPVNPSDVYFALGDYNLPGGEEKTYPYSNGIEGSGQVVGSGGGFFPFLYTKLGVRLALTTGKGATWAEYAVVDVFGGLPLPSDVDTLSGSAALVNPLTVVGFLEVAKEGGHSSILNTAANSALGKMLIRAGKTYGIKIVCVVRGEKNVKDLVENLGHPQDLIIRSDVDTFEEDLKKVIDQNQVTLAFDAVAGKLSETIFNAMPEKSETYMYGMLSGELSPEYLFGYKNNPKSFSLFHLKAWLEEGGILRFIKTAITGRSMLANELKTTFEHVIEFKNEEEVLKLISEYSKYQKGGKIALKID